MIEKEKTVQKSTRIRPTVWAMLMTALALENKSASQWMNEQGEAYSKRVFKKHGFEYKG